jgi:hypothetical protein
LKTVMNIQFHRMLENSCVAGRLLVYLEWFGFKELVVYLSILYISWTMTGQMRLNIDLEWNLVKCVVA